MRSGWSALTGPALTASLAALLAPSFGCSEDEALLRSEVELVHYPEQPMVVDLVFELDPAAEATAVDLDDAGVLSARLDDAADGRARVRLRGLAPDTEHRVELRLSDAGGDEAHALRVTTEPALPGFRASFEVETEMGLEAAELSSDYRLFDLSVLFSDEALGAFVVDGQGTTRWHQGAAPQSTGLGALWTGLSLRDTGELLFLRDDAALIVDELGHEQLRIEAADLGVLGFHHDIVELPDGNFVALSLSYRDIDYGPEGVLPVAGDVLVEFTPAGEVVWIWDSFDHLDTARRSADFWGAFVYVHPETGVEHHDWTHGNGIIYDASRDELLVSMRHQDWLLALDRSTQEIRWTLGPEADFELDAGRWFWHQHSPQWQPDGSLLLYDNGVGDPDLPVTEARSRAVRYAVDRDARIVTQVWEEDAPAFVSTVAGDADRSSDGHLLVLDSLLALDPSDPSAGSYSRIRELDPAASPMGIWTLSSPPGYFSYRAVPLARMVGAGPN